MANVYGGSKDKKRGGWCTNKRWAGYVGPWDLDAFSNPRSNIVASVHCMLERGDDAFGGRDGGARVPGEYLVTNTNKKPLGPGELARPAPRRTIVYRAIADENTRVWIQPDYQFVDEAMTHFGHTRFCALLRFDPPVGWFKPLYRLCELVCVISDKRKNFEPPPGVDESSQPFPHALFYRRAEDATRDVLRRCISWRPR